MELLKQTPCRDLASTMLRPLVVVKSPTTAPCIAGWYPSWDVCLSVPAGMCLWHASCMLTEPSPKVPWGCYHSNIVHIGKKQVKLQACCCCSVDCALWDRRPGCRHHSYQFSPPRDIIKIRSSSYMTRIYDFNDIQKLVMVISHVLNITKIIFDDKLLTIIMICLMNECIRFCSKKW